MTMTMMIMIMRSSNFQLLKRFIGDDDEDVNYEDFNDDKEDGNKNDHGKEDNVKKIAKFGTSNINMLSVEQFKMLVHHKHCNYIQ